MATALSYNGIELTGIKTHSWQRERKRTQDRMDYLCTHHKIEVTAMVARQLNTFDANGNPTNAVAWQSDNNIREFLMRERRQLVFKIDGNTVLNVPSSDTSMDPERGPHPLYCNVTRIDGGQAFIIQYGVEAWVDENRTVLGQNRTIRSNRWTMTDDIDGDWYTTRTIRGKAIFSGEFLQATGKADVLRNRFWPPVLRTMKREKVHVQLSSDGLEIDYHIVDVEKLLPMGIKSPATHFEAQYSPYVSLTSGDSKQSAFGAHFSLRASGPKFVPREWLLTTCLHVAAARFFGANFGPGPSKRFLVYDSKINYYLHINAVEVNLSARLAAPVLSFWEGFPFDTINDQFHLGQNNDRADTVGALQQLFGDQTVAPRMPVDVNSRGTLNNYLISQTIFADTNQDVQPPPVNP